MARPDPLSVAYAVTQSRPLQMHGSKIRQDTLPARPKRRGAS